MVRLAFGYLLLAAGMMLCLYLALVKIAPLNLPTAGNPPAAPEPMSIYPLPSGSGEPVPVSNHAAEVSQL